MALYLSVAATLVLWLYAWRWPYEVENGKLSVFYPISWFIRWALVLIFTLIIWLAWALFFK